MYQISKLVVGGTCLPWGLATPFLGGEGHSPVRPLAASGGVSAVLEGLHKRQCPQPLVVESLAFGKTT